MSKAFDCATPLTAPVANSFKRDGFDAVARYLVPGGWKALTRDEAERISQAGLQIISVYETTANRALGGRVAGLVDGACAVQVAANVGQPEGSTIYFAVDFDARNADMPVVIEYIKAASEATPNFNTGVYGSAAVIKALMAADVCSRFWQTYAWSDGEVVPGINIHQYDNGPKGIGQLMNGISVDLNNTFGNEGGWSIVTEPDKKFNLIKERIYAADGKLKYLDISTMEARRSAYATKATDVRLLKLEKGKVRFEFVARPDAKVSALVKEFGADYGINFPFFDSPAKIPVGTVWDGEKFVNGAYGKMQVWKYFAAKGGIATIGDNTQLEQSDFAVQGSPILVSDGSAAWDYFQQVEQTANDIGRDASGKLVRCQRTFAGIDAAGNLLIAVSDGRTASDQGLTLEEMALYMLGKGAVMAINGDGGSSSVIADQTGGINQAENTGANERAVHHALLFFLQDAPQVPQADDWKQTSIDWLKSVGGITADHSPTETVDMGALASVLKNLGIKS